ncbi:MAG: hypothetical protein JST16_02695 [Bdellovibrionales bacterium]|nr:hypothetical protein [Bdellovibrionales bacterium]
MDPRLLIERLEKLEKNVPALVASARSVVTPSPASFSSREKSIPLSSYKPPAAPGPATSTPPAQNSMPEPAAPAVSATGTGDAPLDEAYAAFLANAEKTKASLATALENAQVRTEENRVTLVFEKRFHHDMAIRSKDMIASELSQRTGRNISVEFKVEAAAAAPATSTVPAPRPTPPPVTSAKSAMRDEADDHFEDIAPQDTSAEVQKALKHFPGAVKREKKQS